MELSLLLNKKRIFTYFNYGLAFTLSLFFLVYAKKLDLNNVNKYILIISLSAIFASIIYSTSIKSKYENGNIIIGITNKTLFLIFLFTILTSIYLGTKSIQLILFFYLNIFYEISLNLLLIYFIKNNKTYLHSVVQLANSLIKVLFLILLSIYFNNLIKIVSIYYIFFLILFLFFYNKLNIFFNSKKRTFKIIDIFYVITGSLIFQIDKILGESLLSKDNYFIYFIIFKIASIFQIGGSILFQPIRNKLISIEKITNDIKLELNFLIKILVLLLIILNFFFFAANYLGFLKDLIIQISINNLLIFNFFSLAFIFHTYNGFYLDALFINDYGKNLFILNSIVLIIQILTMFYFQSLLIWSLLIMTTQIILTIYPIIKYRSNV